MFFFLFVCLFVWNRRNRCLRTVFFVFVFDAWSFSGFLFLPGFYYVWFCMNDTYGDGWVDKNISTAAVSRLFPMNIRHRFFFCLLFVFFLFFSVSVDMYDSMTAYLSLPAGRQGGDAPCGVKDDVVPSTMWPGTVNERVRVWCADVWYAVDWRLDRFEHRSACSPAQNCLPVCIVSFFHCCVCVQTVTFGLFGILQISFSPCSYFSSFRFHFFLAKDRFFSKLTPNSFRLW